MQVTAIIQNNTLIIPNVDLTHLKPLADKNGLIEFELPILDKADFSYSPQEIKPKKSIQELAGGLADKTSIVATVNEMNESIAEAYADWEN